ncbi:MAG: hypothetical protein HC809_14770, partial [Gammaproteobacteria bacterium]|nr:hypothetical protein [Gammaproteobacteria bacterium]
MKSAAHLLLVVAAAGLSACSTAELPGVTQVMSLPSCKHIDKGARLISYADLAKL